MGAKKNRLKERVNVCFLCGKPLADKSEKIIHRINTKKQNRQYNILILCPCCKEKVLKCGINKEDINSSVLEVYFQNFDKDCRHIVMEKVYKYILGSERLDL